MLLYRPVGLNELRLIYQSGMTEFPPRLPEQPIFYPVLNYPYAEKIARDWNTKSEPWAGYITRFEVEDKYAARFEPQIVGASWHEELWVPAEELAEFNRHIRPPIKVVGAYFGSKFQGEKDRMKGYSAVNQFVHLTNLFDYSLTDFKGETLTNHQATFLNYPFWLQHDFTAEGISCVQRDEILDAIKIIWAHQFPYIPLPALTED